MNNQADKTVTRLVTMEDEDGFGVQDNEQKMEGYTSSDDDEEDLYRKNWKPKGKVKAEDGVSATASTSQSNTIPNTNTSSRPDLPNKGSSTDSSIGYPGDKISKKEIVDKALIVNTKRSSINTGCTKTDIAHTHDESEEQNQKDEKINMTPIVQLKRLSVNLLNCAKHGTVHSQDTTKEINKDLEIPAEDVSDEDQTSTKRKNLVEHFQEFIKKKSISDQKKVTDYYRSDISRRASCLPSDTVNSSPIVESPAALSPHERVLSNREPSPKQLEIPQEDFILPKTRGLMDKMMRGGRMSRSSTQTSSLKGREQMIGDEMTRQVTTREDETMNTDGLSKISRVKESVPWQFSPPELVGNLDGWEALQLQRIKHLQPKNVSEKASTSNNRGNQTKNLPTVNIRRDLMRNRNSAESMASIREQGLGGESRMRCRGDQIKRGAARMRSHSVRGLGAQDIAGSGNSMSMAFTRGQGDLRMRGALNIRSPSMSGLGKRGAARMRSHSARGLGAQDIAGTSMSMAFTRGSGLRARGASRMRSHSVRGLGEQGIVTGSRMRSPSLTVRRLGEHRMGDYEWMRLSAGRGLGHDKITDGDQTMLTLGSGREEPIMRGVRGMIPPNSVEGRGPMMNTSMRMALPVGRGRGVPRMGDISGVRLVRNTFREERSPNEVSCPNQEVIEVVDISEDDSPLKFRSSAGQEEFPSANFPIPIQPDFSLTGSSGSILQNSSTVNFSRPILAKLKNRDVSVSVSRKKEVQLPPGLKLPSSITVFHLPANDNSKRRNVSNPERIVKILSGDDSQNTMPKKKVELELSDPQIEIMMDLGLL